MGYAIHTGRKRVFVPRTPVDLPPLCTVCSANTTETLTIKGSGNKASDYLRAAFGSMVYLKMAVPVCRACRRKDGFALGRAVLGTIVACALACWLISAYGLEEGHAFVAGIVLFGAAPLVGLLYFVRATKRPTIINFDDEAVELRVSSGEYLQRLAEWCGENGIAVEVSE